MNRYDPSSADDYKNGGPDPFPESTVDDTPQDKAIYRVSIAFYIVSALLVLIGAILQWISLYQLSGSDYLAAAAGYYTIAGPLQWLFCDLSGHYYQKGKRAHAGLFMFHGVAILAFINTNYPAWRRTNFWRVFLNSGVAQEPEVVRMELAGEVMTYIGAWLALVAAMLLRQAHTQFNRDVSVLIASTVAGVGSAIGAIILYTSHNLDIPLSQSSSADFLDRESLYQESSAVVEKSLFLTALLMMGVWFDVLEVVAEACFFLGEHSIFLFSNVFLAEHFRNSLFVDPQDEISQLYVGGIFCWCAVILAFVAALMFFRDKMG